MQQLTKTCTFILHWELAVGITDESLPLLLTSQISAFGNEKPGDQIANAMYCINSWKSATHRHSQQCSFQKIKGCILQCRRWSWCAGQGSCTRVAPGSRGSHQHTATHGRVAKEVWAGHQQPLPHVQRQPLWNSVTRTMVATVGKSCVPCGLSSHKERCSYPDRASKGTLREKVGRLRSIRELQK